MNPRTWEMKRQFLVNLLKQAQTEGNKGAEKFIRKELDALNFQKVTNV